MRTKGFYSKHDYSYSDTPSPLDDATIAAAHGITPSRVAAASRIERSEDQGHHLFLMRRAASREAISYVEDLIGVITPKGARRTDQMRDALGALLGDLLAIHAAGPNCYGFRSIGDKAFAGHRIGREPYIAIIKRLEAQGYIEREAGVKQPPRKGVKGKATIITALPRLLDDLAGFGITRDNVDNHFDELFEPVILKAASTRAAGSDGAKSDKVPGKKLPIDHIHRQVRRSSQVVTEINAVLETATFDFGDPRIPPPRFRRIFNNGDAPSYGYDQGGRLYASFQNMERDKRGGILINGEAVCEIDISSSHYSIVLATLGFPFDPNRDYYSIPGFPRVIVKSYVTSCVGQGRKIRDWPADLIAEYAEPDTDKKKNVFKHQIEAAGYAYSGDLEADYPIETVKAKTAEQFPALKELKAAGLNWAPLSFIESEAVIGAVHELCKIHGIPCLPVHDSIIAPVSKADIVAEVLSRHFENVVGTKPKLSQK